MGGGRENESSCLVIEEDPRPVRRPVRSALTESIATEDAGVAQVMKPFWIGRDGWEGFGCCSRGREPQLEQDHGTMIIHADGAGSRGPVRRPILEFDRSESAGEVSAWSRDQIDRRRIELAGKG